MKIFMYLVLVVLLSSCSIFKQAKKTAYSRSSDSVSTHETVYQRIDTTKTVIIEKIDTLVSSPEFVVKKNFTLATPANGAAFPGFAENLAILDTGMISLQLSYNALTNSIEATIKKKKEDLPAVINRKTIIQKHISESGSTRDSTSQKSKQSGKETASDPVLQWVWLAAAFFILIAIVMYTLYRRSFRL